MRVLLSWGGGGHPGSLIRERVATLLRLEESEIQRPFHVKSHVRAHRTVGVWAWDGGWKVGRIRSSVLLILGHSGGHGRLTSAELAPEENNLRLGGRNCLVLHAECGLRNAIVYGRTRAQCTSLDGASRLLLLLFGHLQGGLSVCQS